MIFRQLFDEATWTYTYLLASGKGREAVIIDPVIEHTDMYLTLIDQLGIKLVRAMDTHVHADHITALGSLREKTHCITNLGEQTDAECVSETFKDGDVINVDGIKIKTIHTPGHTNDSYSFVMDDRVFTGDTLLIRGSGRTDFQAGSPEDSWDSITGKLFTLPEETLVYPGHDYKGWTVSSIGEEKHFNPRLAGKTREEYIEIMNNLNLPDPKLMDIAVPANLKCGRG